MLGFLTNLGCSISLRCTCKGPHGAFYLYGDPAYGVSNHLVSPYKGAVVTEEQAAFNRSMSPVE